MRKHEVRKSGEYLGPDLRMTNTGFIMFYRRDIYSHVFEV
jgi:hypothetical protein